MSKIKKRKEAIATLNKLMGSPENVLAIHYSCESFYDKTDGKSPRITSIAVRYLKSAQTTSFSIHQIGERENFNLAQIENKYDELERKMLEEFFDFVRTHSGYKWLHWNMRDINYGFHALEHRFKVLGGQPVVINDEQKFDLARILIDMYSVSYAPHPRLPKLIEMNKIAPKDFLSGADEAIAFTNKDYVKLHQSTLRKVDVINNIAQRAYEGTLKTSSKLKEIYGVSPQGIYELIKDHWFFGLLATILVTIAGILMQNAFSGNPK